MADVGLRDGIVYGTGGPVSAAVEDDELVVRLPGFWQEPWRVPISSVKVVVPGRTTIVDGVEPALPILRTATARKDDLLGLVFSQPVQFPPPRAAFVDSGVHVAKAAFLGARNIYVRPEELAERGATTGLSLQVDDRAAAIEALLASGAQVAESVPGRRVVRQGNVMLAGAWALLGVATLGGVAGYVLGPPLGLAPDLTFAIGMALAPVVAALAMLTRR